MTFFLKFNLSGIYSNILSCISSDILSGILSDISSEILCGRGRRGSLWSSGYCSGPAGNTAMTSLQLRIGGWHSDPGFAVRVRRGPLRSRVFSWGPVGNILDPACKWGPAGNWSGPAGIAAITILQLRSGGEHSSSRACCSGPVGASAIISLQLISGGEHSAPEFAVLVRQGPLRCSAGNSFGRWRRRKRRRRKRKTRPPDIKFNNPHLTSGEISETVAAAFDDCIFFCFCWKHCIAAVGNIE